MLNLKTLGTALAAGAIATLVAVLPAQGQDPPSSRTLVLVSAEKHSEQRFLDLRPKGPSVGDRWLLATTLSQDGATAGRLAGECAGVDKRFGVLQCNVVVILRDGRLMLQGAAVDRRIPGVSGPGEEYVVTGGTGAYAGATGVMRRTGEDPEQTLTFVLGA